MPSLPQDADDRWTNAAVGASCACGCGWLE
jgi:hypothetical protein